MSDNPFKVQDRMVVDIDSANRASSRILEESKRLHGEINDLRAEVERLTSLGHELVGEEEEWNQRRPGPPMNHTRTVRYVVRLSDGRFLSNTFRATPKLMEAETYPTQRDAGNAGRCFRGMGTYETLSCVCEGSRTLQGNI